MSREIVILLCVAVMVMGAYQLGRIAERWKHWGEAFDRLNSFRFTHPEALRSKPIEPRDD